MDKSRTEARAVGGIFPGLLPDALFYSAAARFPELMQFRSITAVREPLFGSRDITTVVVDVSSPSHLQPFLDRLPHDHPYTVSELIRKHGLFLFHAPFVPAGRCLDYELVRQGEFRGIPVTCGFQESFQLPASIQSRCVTW